MGVCVFYLVIVSSLQHVPSADGNDEGSVRELRRPEDARPGGFVDEETDALRHQAPHPTVEEVQLRKAHHQ